MTITIPPELVALVRDGLYFDLQGRLEEMDSAIRSRERQDVRVVIEAGVEWAGGALALLDVVGWLDVVEERAVEVDVCRHREVLLGAISTRTQSERAVQGDANASDEDRSHAIAREKQLATLATRIGGASGAGSVVVPASLVDLLREALVSVVADCAEAIEDDARDHPGSLDETLLRRFDAYRALLEQVGLQGTVPAVEVEVDLSVHRATLMKVLRERRECERYLMCAVDTTRSRHRVARIEEFMSAAGLQEERDRRAAFAFCDEGSDPVAWGCG